MSTIAERLGITRESMRAQRFEILERYARKCPDGKMWWCHKARGKVTFVTEEDAVACNAEMEALPLHVPGRVYPCGPHFHVTTRWAGERGTGS